ncbi:ribonuclease, Rne/Rng family [Desulfosporosinus orientis DSM 765]|uniref:Ribonuclease, Rne/Rng family n=1 Tax=Desulfosporosinus orientis (strain ATCC 19365 / DSM 765 / NCIMB 8382 / VKM B-1628 / Singapore I) TaxID=768706 RepID=G7W777_DESOD|nr:Rne/Rng family ribonuclease [Desulfosporosinus orientis]AET70585.1 ribonuclease, Rne/Rng family [Desulfosporosinus orientis DSM 765]
MPIPTPKPRRKEIVLQSQNWGKSSQSQKIRAAVFEQGQLMEVFEEEENSSHMVGNIYRGRVENVLPGMQAAFVDIGLEKNGFLYVADALPANYDEEDKPSPVIQERIENILKPRQELLVQITKEPVGTKGARISVNLTLPGRYVVLLPQVSYVGISRKIEDNDERERLRNLAAASKPEGMGVIVRTLAEGIDGEEIAQDIARLAAFWQSLVPKIPHVSVPGLVHRDVDLVSRLIRDWIDQDVEKITVDNDDISQILRKALQEIEHPAAKQIYVISGADLFAKYGVDAEIRKGLRSKVWLKSGGYLVIQQTEALIVIDVNTGKYVGQRSLEETVVHTNLEAAEEIARQLRLRNLGGIIVIDFIDMVTEEAQKQVLEALETVCSRDKTKSQVLGLTQLGLVEMTRKKVGQTLAVRYTSPCPNCDGTGWV